MTFRLRHLLVALVLHALLFGLLVSGLQCSRPPTRPPVIRAVLLDPDRKEAAQQKRADDQRRKQADAERKRKEAEARRKLEQEQQRREAEAQKQKLAADAQRKKAEDLQKKKVEDLQKKKELAEQKKAEDQARRKKEQEEKQESQEQARREIQERARMEEEMRRESVQREAAREQEARAATEREAKLAQWADLLERHVQKFWIRPAAAPAEFECTVRVQLLPDGSVTSARIDQTCGSGPLDKSVEDAVYRASPLPKPADPGVFDRDLYITFRP